MSSILVTDDDVNIRELISTLLSAEGYEVHEAADGRQALGVAGRHHIDLCILDIMMPGMDGYAFCKAARLYHNFPILMLTAKAETKEKVRGFELGADDYLTKPFAPAELLVRVKALLKRYNIAASQSVRVGRLVIDKNRYCVLDGGTAADIPMKEFELLFLLGSYPGKTLARDTLIEEVWGYDFDGNERTLDVHIGRLRERFTPAQHGFKITTIRGLGYRLEVL